MPFSWNDLQFWRKPEAVTNPRLNTLLFICRSERFSENAFKSFFSFPFPLHISAYVSRLML